MNHVIFSSEFWFLNLSRETKFCFVNQARKKNVCKIIFPKILKIEDFIK